MERGSVVLVTGASRGLGNHLARHFLERGSIVFGCSRSRYEGIEHPSYAHHVADVTSEADVTRLFRAIRSAHGRLDVVVNNAVCRPSLSLLALTSVAEARHEIETNLLGPLLVCREAVRLMARRRYGRIVNLGSAASRHLAEGETVYAGSKAAVDAMTRVLAKEVVAHGITCNVVAPTLLDTGLGVELPAERVRAAVARNGLEESIEDVTGAIDWLVGPAGAAVTGQIVYLGSA